MANQTQESLPRVHLRLLTSALVGIIGAMLVGIFISWKYAALGGWDIGALSFLIKIWIALHKLGPSQTSKVSTIEYPGRAGFDGLLIVASLASLAAVGILFFQAGRSAGSNEVSLAALGITSVVISWAIVHTVYALKYATVYYKNNGGIDFNTNSLPNYSDFAYLAFTIGMTFQVSDTNLKTPEFRKIVIGHAFLSYLFGTVIVASAISLILGLGR